PCPGPTGASSSAPPKKTPGSSPGEVNVKANERAPHPSAKYVGFLKIGDITGASVTHYYYDIYSTLNFFSCNIAHF
ncbi:MAG: hypothetical protein WCJ41_20040, partial [Aestuariivirga sp.]|uniref:hypothetical protein n=1 Tax=Aestuariivirga sp. TaxID=2650926 RepID=UPI00301679BA